jgi:hypothetical protein
MSRSLRAAGFLVLAATVAWAGDQPPIYVKFDGEVGKNPSSPGVGKIKASGTFEVPPGCKLKEVIVLVGHRGRPSAGKLVVRPKLDETASPNAWSFDKDGFEEFKSEATVEAQLVVTNAAGQQLTYESREIRMAFVEQKK